MKFFQFSSNPFFRKTALLTFLLLVLMVCMNLFFPQKQVSGYSSFIVAFEFAQTPEELATVFDGLNQDDLKNVDTGNYIDFGFMITYSILIGYLFFKSAKVFKRKWLFFGVFLSAIVFSADFAENIILLKITKTITNPNTNEVLSQYLEKLHLITWLKWGTLAFTFFIFYEVLMRTNWIFRILGLICLFPLIYIIIAGKFTPEKISLFTSSIFGGYFVLIVFGLFYKKKNRSM